MRKDPRSALAVSLLLAAVPLIACNPAEEAADLAVYDEPTGASSASEQIGGERALDSSRFVEQASADGTLEVRLGEIAQRQAQSPSVQDFGRRMVDDHMQANRRLEQIARALDRPPTAQLPQEQQSAFERLGGLAGESFDREYVRAMVEAHQRAVALFREASTATEVDPELQRFARDLLPSLERHLAGARELQRAGQ